MFRLFDQLESVEMHNNIIVANGGSGPNVMRADASEFMWVNGTNIAGSNNLVMNGATNVPSQWNGTINSASAGLVNLTSDPRPVAGSPVVGAGKATPAGPAGFAFPNGLWPPAFHPPLQALIPAGSAAARPSDAAIDIGAFELGGATTGTGGAAGGGGSGRRVAAAARVARARAERQERPGQRGAVAPVRVARERAVASAAGRARPAEPARHRRADARALSPTAPRLGRCSRALC